MATFRIEYDLVTRMAFTVECETEAEAFDHMLNNPEKGTNQLLEVPFVESETLCVFKDGEEVE